MGPHMVVSLSKIGYGCTIVVVKINMVSKAFGNPKSETFAWLVALHREGILAFFCP